MKQPNNKLNVTRITKTSVLNEDADFKSLIKTYREVFGSDERDGQGNVIWGEGFRCERCGKTYPLNLVLFKVCECGGPLTECYATDNLKSRLIDEIDINSSNEGFCFSLKNNGVTIGFLWGALTGKPEVVDQICNNGLKTQRHREDVAKLFDDDERILYLAELGILRSSRVGLRPLVLMFTELFLLFQDKTIDSVVAWTSKSSQVYRITRALGFKLVAEIEGLCIIKDTKIRWKSMLKLKRS